MICLETGERDFACLERLLRSFRRVTTAEGEALAKKIGAAFVESSAKDNKNVSE